MNIKATGAVEVINLPGKFYTFISVNFSLLNIWMKDYSLFFYVACILIFFGTNLMQLVDGVLEFSIIILYSLPTTNKIHGMTFSLI